LKQNLKSDIIHEDDAGDEHLSTFLNRW